MSAVLVDVESSTELMGRMNEINTSYGPPHVVLVDRTIWVQGSRPSEGLDPEDLSLLIDNVCDLARHVAGRLPASSGDQVNVLEEPEEAPVAPSIGVGAYL